MVATINNWHLYAAALTALESRMAGVAFSFLASMEKLESIAGIDIDNGSKDHSEIKERIMEHEAALLSYLVYSHEAAIMSLQNLVESTANELKRDGWIKFDAFKNDQQVCYLDELKFVRAVSNVLKHNEGSVNRKSESGKHLIDTVGLIEGYEIESFILSRNINFYIPDLIVKIYLACLSMIQKAFGESPHRFLSQRYDETFDEIFHAFLPDWLEIRRPKKQPK